MIQWVVEAAALSGVGKEVVVATPDQEIIDVCDRFGARAVMTSDTHISGTDRIAEVALTIASDVYINVQGDEPLIEPETIRACAEALLGNADAQMSSVCSPCPDDEVSNPAVVKVVVDSRSMALYFSRSPIPYPRNLGQCETLKHVGIYGYRREPLLQFAQWAPTPLERSEGLEQLRFLENGVRIAMARGEGSKLAVDTPEQADEVRRILSELQASPIS